MSDTNSLQSIIAAAEQADNTSNNAGEKKLPPVHLWNPDYCGDIGLRIARDGQWYYAGSPIGRKRLVRLFSTILRHDEDGAHYLVTPAEKILVAVEDAPFIATLMYAEGTGRTQVLRFETNVGDITEVGAAHALRMEIDATTGAPSPYVHVRARLEALIARAVFYDLMALGVVVGDDFGVWSGGQFFALAPAALVQEGFGDD